MTAAPRDPLQVRLAGAGGQGVILAGVLLAEAGMHDGRHVAATQSYGPEARLGAAKAEVILSGATIVFPEVRVPDVVLCLSAEAYAEHARPVAPGGLLVMDQRIPVGDDAPGLERVVLPLVETAHELGPGGEVAANVVALGALAALWDVVSEAGLRRALRERVKPQLLEINERALAAGLALGRAARAPRALRD